MTGGFTQVFGGQALYPAQPTYIALNISANAQLAWPIEQQVAGPNVVAAIIDVNASSPGLQVSMPDARQAATGNAVLLNNVGVQTVTILDNLGNTLLSLTANVQWFLYLADNSTQQGTWRAYQLGATTSVANAAVLAGAGLAASGNQLNQVMLTGSISSSAPLGSTNLATATIWAGGVGVLNLPNATTVGNGWFTVIKNLGSGNVVLTPQGIQTIDSALSVAVAPGQGCFIGCDGTQFFSVGLGTAGSGSFDFTTLNVSGAGNFPLTGAALNRIAYRLTGLLTGNRAIIVPGTIQEYWIDNETMGTYTLSVGTSGQVSPIVIVQGQRAILYCDGTNVLSATSSQSVYPITIAQGGTGAETSSAALVNLGAVPATRNINSGSGLLGGASLATDITLTVDSSIVPLLAAPLNTFIGGGANQGITISATSPRYTLINNTAATDSGLWDTVISGTTLLGRIVNDAQTSALAWYQVTRNATSSLTSIIFSATQNQLQLLNSGEALRIVTTNPRGTGQVFNTWFDPTGRKGYVGFASSNDTMLLGSDIGSIAIYANGAETFTFTGAGSTGSSTPSLTANKPGANNSVAIWIPVTIASTQYWLPLFGN